MHRSAGIRVPILLMLPSIALILSAYVVEAVPQARGGTTDEQQIKQVVAATTEGMNKHNAKGIADLYTPDGELDNVFGARWKGPAEIEEGLKVHFDAELKHAVFKTSAVDIRFIRPDVAVAHVSNEVSGITGPNGQKVPTHDERSVRVFVKTNGKWLVTVFHNTAVSPGEPPKR